MIRSACGLAIALLRTAKPKQIKGDFSSDIIDELEEGASAKWNPDVVKGDDDEEYDLSYK